MAHISYGRALGDWGTILPSDRQAWTAQASGVTVDLLLVWAVADLSGQEGFRMAWAAGVVPVILKSTSAFPLMRVYLPNVKRLMSAGCRPEAWTRLKIYLEC